MKLTLLYITSLFLVITFVSTTNTLAQNQTQNTRIKISGKVQDLNNSTPIIGANISSFAKNNGTLSNNYGEYTIMADSESDTIECSFLGYCTQKIALQDILETAQKDHKSNTNRLLTHNFELSADSISIDGIIINTNNDMDIGSKFGRINVNTSQLKYIPLFMGEQDILKYFQMLPGITGGSEGSSDVNIRGGSSDQTLMLLDNIPIYNHNHALGFVSIFNGDIIHSANLYKGSIPTEYGGRLSGVSSLKTRQGNTQKHSQSLTIGTLTAGFTAEGPMARNKSSYIVSARYFTPNLLLGLYNLIRNSPNQYNYAFGDITANLSFRLNQNNTLSWGIYTGYDGLRFNVRNTNYDQENQSQKINTKNTFTLQSIASSLEWNLTLSNGSRLTTSLYATGIDNKENYKFSNLTLSQSSSNRIQSSLLEIGLRSVCEQNIKKHTLRYGATATLQLLRPKNTTVEVNQNNYTSTIKTNNNIECIAIFASDQIALGRWSLNYGLRIPLYITQDGVVSDLEPRIGVAFDAGKQNNLYLSLDRNTQAIFSLNGQNGSYPMDFWMPILDKKLQSSNQVSLGWKFTPHKNWMLSIEGFYKHMDNLYFVYDQDLILEAKNHNNSSMKGYDLGSGKSFGGELVLQYTTKRTMAMFSWSQSKSLRTVNNHTYIYNYDIPLNLNLFVRQQTLHRGARKHYISANVNFRIGIPFMVSNEIYPGIDIGSKSVLPNLPDFPEARLSNYFRLDLNYSMEKQLANGARRIWQISILNATAHFNPYIAFATEQHIEAYCITPFMPSFSYKRYF